MMRLLLTCYCNDDGPYGEDGDTIFVSCGAEGPFGIDQSDVSERLGQTVSLTAVSPLPNAGDFFRYMNDVYPVLWETPDPDFPDHTPIPHIDLTVASDFRDEGDLICGDGGSL